MWILDAVHKKLDTILRKLDQLLSRNDTAVLKRIDQLETKLSDRLAAIEELLSPPPDAPPPITVWRMVSERKEHDMWFIKFEADLPPIEDTPNNRDVVSHRIRVFVDGSEYRSQDLPRDATVVEFEVPKGSEVVLKGSYLDDDNNEGAHRESQTFVAADTIPPDAPGDFGEIRNLGEREVVE